MANVPSPSIDPDSILGMIPKDPEAAKFLNKLVDTVGHGLGVLYEPVRTWLNSKAETSAALNKARTDSAIEVLKARTEGEVELVRIGNRDAIREARDRSPERVRRREEQRQVNLEAITAKAALDPPESVSEDPVDPDWVAEWFNLCQDVSSEDMQTLWARILAGEIAEPGSFSLRTLAFVKMLRRQDAEVITRFCSMIWTIDGTLTPFCPAEELMYELPPLPVSFTEILAMDVFGFAKFDYSNGFESKVAKDHVAHMVYFGQEYRLEWHRRSQDRAVHLSFPLGKALLTDIGMELAPIAGAQANSIYKDSILKVLSRHGWVAQRS